MTELLISDVLKSLDFSEAETACDAHKIIRIRLLDLYRYEGGLNADDIDEHTTKNFSDRGVVGWFDVYDICDLNIFSYFLEKVADLAEACRKAGVQVR